MIIADHERDLKLFKKAAQCNDPEVSAFAKRYLPLIQSDLEKIKKIKLDVAGSNNRPWRSISRHFAYSHAAIFCIPLTVTCNVKRFTNQSSSP